MAAGTSQGSEGARAADALPVADRRRLIQRGACALVLGAVGASGVLPLGRLAHAQGSAGSAASSATPAPPAVAGASAASGPAPRPDRKPVTLVVQARMSLRQLPVVVADQLGYFKAEGVPVEIVDAPDTAALHPALLDGGADVLCGPFEQVLSLQARGRGFRAFSMLARSPQSVLGVSPKALASWRGPADLRGRAVGVLGVGSAGHRLTQLVLANGGLRPDEARYVTLASPAEALWAFRTGEVDALAHVDPLITTLEQRGEIRIVADTRLLKDGERLFGGPVVSSCLAASADFIDKNPQACQGMAHALVHALKWLQTAGPSDIVKTVPEHYLGSDRAIYLAAFNKMRHTLASDGVLPDAAPANTLKAFTRIEPDAAIERLAPAKTYTNEFALKAKARFKA